jgi:hypothetical protein
MLWLDKHKPKLRVIPPEVQTRLDAGNDFGDRAMGMFGPYEEMTVYLPGTTIPDKKKMIARTQEHLRRGTAVICEAAFSNYNNAGEGLCSLGQRAHLGSEPDAEAARRAPGARGRAVHQAL